MHCCTKGTNGTIETCLEVHQMSAHPHSEEFSFTDARSNLTEIANAVAYRGKRIIITRKGKQLVAIIPIEDLEILQQLEDHIDLDDAKKALADVKKHGSVSWESLKRKLDL